LNDSSKYVCAFGGRRDYYQVAVALAEADMLDMLITDAYFGRIPQMMELLLPRPLTEKMRFRHESAIPIDRVKCLWGTLFELQARRRFGFADWEIFAKLDRKLSLAAAVRARRTCSDLFLYNPYAWEAFTARYRHTPKKVLFQFHPHPDLERRILQEDSARHRIFHYSYEEEMGDSASEEVKRRTRDCWRHADLILCASEFTRLSLIEAGADCDQCEIVPYGIDLPYAHDERATPESFHVLFVGLGTQRKGLHHLLLAWQIAALPPDSRLTVVCRSIDHGVEALAHSVPRVNLVRGLSGDALQSCYKRSAVLAVPALVEGFGQVCLEALAQGCPVLGTPNTCLPDIGPSGAIFLVAAGAIEQLAAELEMLSRSLPGNYAIRTEARACAARWPWAHFRQGIRSALHPTSSKMTDYAVRKATLP
jgi:glycosyltransferase involved in cell wall biosynthesis